MNSDLREVCQHVIRRVRYAANTLALLESQLPPEGPFDVALTNGLVVIVASEWPGEEKNKDGKFLRSARDLLDIIQTKRESPLDHVPVAQEVNSLQLSDLLNIVEAKRDSSLTYVSVDVLREGLDLTQPFRHGRADDEFATIRARHIKAVEALDQHPSLRFLDKARSRSLDDAMVLAFEEQAEEYLPIRPKDRLEVPAPDNCPECWRRTFLPSEWDAFGGTCSAGVCIACGYERSDDEAWQEAVAEAIERGTWE
jgi:hypothetical protein